MKIQDWMSDVRAADVMTSQIVTLRPEDTLADVAGRLIAYNFWGATVSTGYRCWRPCQ